jgi:hypothetical protein
MDPPKPVKFHHSALEQYKPHARNGSIPMGIPGEHGFQAVDHNPLSTVHEAARTIDSFFQTLVFRWGAHFESYQGPKTSTLNVPSPVVTCPRCPGPCPRITWQAPCSGQRLVHGETPWATAVHQFLVEAGLEMAPVFLSSRWTAPERSVCWNETTQQSWPPGLEPRPLHATPSGEHWHWIRWQIVWTHAFPPNELLAWMPTTETDACMLLASGAQRFPRPLLAFVAAQWSRRQHAATARLPAHFSAGPTFVCAPLYELLSFDGVRYDRPARVGHPRDSELMQSVGLQTHDLHELQCDGAFTRRNGIRPEWLLPRPPLSEQASKDAGWSQTERVVRVQTPDPYGGNFFRLVAPVLTSTHAPTSTASGYPVLLPTLTKFGPKVLVAESWNQRGNMPSFS